MKEGAKSHFLLLAVSLGLAASLASCLAWESYPETYEFSQEVVPIWHKHAYAHLHERGKDGWMLVDSYTMGTDRVFILQRKKRLDVRGVESMRRMIRGELSLEQVQSNEDELKEKLGSDYENTMLRLYIRDRRKAGDIILED